MKILWLMTMAAVLPGINGLASEADHAATPLQLYNDGTKQLDKGKFQEAEACFQGAVASQDERIQPPALYNLGEVRFRQGAEELKKGPQPKATDERTATALEVGSDAIRMVDAALASQDEQAMLSAYFQGRGARHELKDAMGVVKKAMDTYGAVLSKWQRAAGDFKSSHELSPADVDAKTNAEVVDRYIAKLIDREQINQMAMQGMAKQRSDLGKKLAKLKQKMPGGDADKMKGKGDDDDDDDEKDAKGPTEGEKEPGPKDGKEMQLTQEEAARLLDMLKLDGNRKLAMGTNEMIKPKDRKGRDW
jgi:tetratricopeptide (TPR) repeat protein